MAPTPGIATEGGSFRVIIQWLDPIGSPSVVGRASFPPGLNPSPSPTRFTGTIITADANVGVTYEQLETLEAQLKTLYGQPASQAYSHAQLHPEDHPTALTLLFTGSDSQVSEYVAALKASGLFFSGCGPPRQLLAMNSHAADVDTQQSGPSVTPFLAYQGGSCESQRTRLQYQRGTQPRP